jgi:hypothetical protein
MFNPLNSVEYCKALRVTRRPECLCVSGTK